jgi:hypothetical protein
MKSPKMDIGNNKRAQSKKQNMIKAQAKPYGVGVRSNTTGISSGS